jgi:hypothetical protein
MGDKVPKEIKSIARILKSDFKYAIIDNNFVITNGIIAFAGPVHLFDEEYFKDKEKLSDNLAEKIKEYLNTKFDTGIIMQTEFLDCIKSLTSASSIELYYNDRIAFVSVDQWKLISPVIPIENKYKELTEEKEEKPKRRGRPRKEKEVPVETEIPKESVEEKTPKLKHLRKNPLENL